MTGNSRSSGFQSPFFQKGTYYEPDEITSSLIRIGRNGIEPLLDVYKTPFLAIERTPNGAGEI